MGCNESKHSVATDNTAISHRKKSNKRSHQKIVNPIESIPESATANATTKKESLLPTKPSESDNPNKVSIESSNNKIDEVVTKAAVAASDLKDISVNLPIVDKDKEEEEEDKKEETTSREDVATGERKMDQENVNKVASQDQSLDHEDYFSSRKERGSIDSFVSDHDGYYSPNHELPTPREGKDDHASDEHDVKIDNKDEVEGQDHQEKGKELAQKHENEKQAKEVVVEALANKQANVISPSAKEAIEVTKMVEKQSPVNAIVAPPGGLQREEQTAT